MNQEDIIRMAREAWGLEFIPHSDVLKLERFAALVAAHESEACAKECDIQSAWGNDDERFGARQCAFAIRARGQK